jgi:hypothetical protein
MRLQCRVFPRFHPAGGWDSARGEPL